MIQHIQPPTIRLEATSSCQLRCPSCPTASGETKLVWSRDATVHYEFDEYVSAKQRRAITDALGLWNGVNQEGELHSFTS